MFSKLAATSNIHSLIKEYYNVLQQAASLIMLMNDLMLTTFLLQVTICYKNQEFSSIVSAETGYIIQDILAKQYQNALPKIMTSKEHRDPFLSAVQCVTDQECEQATKIPQLKATDPEELEKYT